MNIDHINRYVSDVDVFIDFYQDALGYELIDKGIKANGKKYAILKNSGHELFISEKEGYDKENEGRIRHIGYSVDNVDLLLRVMKSKKLAPADTQVIVKAFSKQFYIKDPDGFDIDLIEWTDKMGFYWYLADKNEV
jgi:lactoylglutathione lyase